MRNHEALNDADYFVLPKDITKRSVTLDYTQLSDELLTSNSKKYVHTLLTRTPKPKGRYAFSNIHVVAPALGTSEISDRTVKCIEEGAPMNSKEVFTHRLPSDLSCMSTAMEEYEAIFETASELLLKKADRASLLVFVGCEDTTLDAYATFIGMLPFRGVQTALITRNQDQLHGAWLNMRTPSGVFEIKGLASQRMGKYPLSAVFGPMPDLKISEQVKPWQPIDISSTRKEDNVVEIPFKIGGLTLPMITHNASYDIAMKSLVDLLELTYPKGYTPIISVGETCDALGYGQDLLDACNQANGMLFAHKSGETYKRYDNYGTPKLFETIKEARHSTQPPIIIALGGGVNGNCIGLIASLTNVDFIEVPTTPMHYNDAVTSAKKAFSLVVNDRILSKNILGAFYLPKLAFCLNETLLTISSANAFATVGESCKTMNMLGMANSAVGAMDFNNIMGASEFASDFTKILSEVGGFDALIKFIESPATQRRKKNIIALGKKIAAIRDTHQQEDVSVEKEPTSSFSRGRTFPSTPSLAESASESSSESEDDSQFNENYAELIAERKQLMKAFRKSFHSLPSKEKNSILSFLTVVNKEVVAAKAMFLAYSDPFEKYRALLFEYAHTLGHGVEAFANDLYLKARQLGVEIPQEALRLHGQCVGMAVLWAGEMSKDLGKLTGKGYVLHQSFPYLFNRSGGFSFSPLRELCDELGVGKEEFCEKVLQVVRRDNKRGYCNCSDPCKSVDQLVTSRPGKMLASPDPNAEVRYLVEVDEEWQKNALEKAFDGYFDRTCDLVKGEIVFVDTCNSLSCSKQYKFKSSSSSVATYIRSEVLEAYKKDLPS